MENLQLFELEESKKLSFSSLNLFCECPYRYKKAYIDKAPHLVRQDNMYLGTILHSILYLFFQQSHRSTSTLLELIYSKAPIDLQEKTEEILFRYINSVDVGVEPTFLEKGFKINHLGQTLVGKFDRVDKLSEGFEIIDYKLGESLQAIEDVKNRLQWIFYWVSFEKGFANLGPIKKFSYHFLNSNKIVTLEPTEKELTDARERLDQVINMIMKEQDFLPRKNKHCKDCLLKSECEL